MVHLGCGVRDDGHWHGTYAIEMRATLLRRLGLHPDQPWSAITGPERPGWARAEALRYMIGAPKHRSSKNSSSKLRSPKRRRG